MTSVELVTITEQVVKKSISVCKSVTSSNKLSARTLPVKLPIANKQVLAFKNTETECQKIPYNQKVNKINKVFDIQISKLSLEAILIESSEVMVQNIVDLFRVTMKLRRKKILC
ncbi:8097_t:CDS:2 [Funneliformis mosseae]|uniref:8097_t:CDS:1 n=1 Tax=Funneliformis mosseae TaxID=27381 RepID=A0A9N9BIF6_FUNMO|nr:8097_t:CDS:2 [Funneliformis mosseae]